MEAALNNELVLQTVFEFLDVDSLKECRLVSKHWNKEVCHILSKKVHFHLLDPISSQRCIISCLENSKHPEYIFKHVKLLWFANSQTQSYIKTVLKKFGKYLESCSPCNVESGMQFYFSLLNVWCPNLRELKVQNIEHNKKLYPEEVQKPNLKFVTPLNLKSFILAEVYRTLEPTTSKPNSNSEIADWVFEIIRASPGLKILNLCDQNEFVFECNLPKIYQGLNQIPSIFNSLREFNCELFVKGHEEYDNLLQFLSSLNNLQKLSFKVVTRNVNTSLPPKKFFKGVRYSLKWLRCNGIFHSSENREGLLSCVEWFPNLEFFCYEDSWCNLPLDPVQFQGLKIPHKNLKKLVMLHVGYEMCSTEDLKALVNSFPNLIILHVDFYTREMSIDGIEYGLRLKQYFEITSQLKALQELSVITYVDNVYELEKAMLEIQNFKSLKRLTVADLNAKYKPRYEEPKRMRNAMFQNHQEIFEVIHLENLQDLLLGVKHLNQFRLIGFIMDDDDEVRKFAEDNRIPLNLGKWGDFRKERPSWFCSYFDTEY